MIYLEKAGLLFCAEETMVPTALILATDGGLKFGILRRNVGQKWLGCMWTTSGHLYAKGGPVLGRRRKK